MFHNALHSPTAKKILVNRRLEWCQLEQAKHSTAKACMLHTTCAVRERHAMCVVVMQPHVCKLWSWLFVAMNRNHVGDHEEATAVGCAVDLRGCDYCGADINQASVRTEL